MFEMKKNWWVAVWHNLCAVLRILCDVLLLIEVVSVFRKLVWGSDARGGKKYAVCTNRSVTYCTHRKLDRTRLSKTGDEARQGER